MRAPLKYFGGKWRLAEWIVGNLPVHETYAELFGGSAAVLLTKSRAKNEVYNDLNGDVVRFFRVLRSRQDELERAVALTPYSREELELACQPDDDVDDLEAARRTAVRGWMTRSGYRTGKSSLQFQRDPVVSRPPQSRWMGVHSRLQPAADRLRGVLIERDDWAAVARRFDAPTTLFYLDPPYLAHTRSARWEYEHEMGSIDQHAALLDEVVRLRGMVVISGYRSELYDERLVGWVRKETAAVTSGKTTTECLWLSPSASAATVQGVLGI